MRNTIKDDYHNSNVQILDFSDNTSDTHCKLAGRKLAVAKLMYKTCDKFENYEEREALFQNIRECCMMSAEHSQKAILYADVNHSLFSPQLCSHFRSSHDNGELQKEQQIAGVEVLESNDIAVLNDEISGTSKSKLCYSQIRYNTYDFNEESVWKAIGVAEKAYNNLLSYING